MYRNSDLRKAIAFSLFVKAHSRNSIIKNWNINKLHDITFQFHKGTIKTSYYLYCRQRNEYFNSIKVQLKHLAF